MKTETREIYKCDHCKKIYLVKRFAIPHEQKCRKNPANYQACMDCCIHLEPRKTEYHYDTFCGSDTTIVTIFYCYAKKEYVYPYWVSGYNEDDLGDGSIANEPMPKKCKEYGKEYGTD